MQKITNYQELGMILQDIEQEATRSKSYAIFNAQKIKRFTEQNAVSIKIFYERAHDLVMQHAKLDDKGAPLIAPVNGIPQLMFVMPESKIAYDEGVKELWARPVTLHL